MKQMDAWAEAGRARKHESAELHVRGQATYTDDTAELASIVDRLSQVNETRVGNDWRFEHDRDDHVRQLRGIIGFRFTVERVELKFKLSQNHPAANVEGAADALQRLGGEDNRAVAELMQERLARRTSDAGAA